MWRACSRAFFPRNLRPAANDLATDTADDPLQVARGIVNGIVASLALWLVIAGTLAWLLR